MRHLLRMFCAVAGVLAAAGLARAAEPAGTGLTGVWLLDQSVFDGATDPTVKDPPLTPEAKAANDAQIKARAEKGQVFGDRRCLPRGMPSMVINEFATEILETPGRITMINEDNPLARTISLTRKAHLADQDPTYNGDAIGHWEGKTLVVETTNLNDSSSHIPGVFGGETAFVPTHANAVKIIERYHLEKGGKLLVNEMTFENPAVLTRPWTVRYAYHRAEGDAELWEYVCQVDAPGWSERFAGDPQFKGAGKP